MKLFEDGDPCFAPMLNALFAAFRGTAVMSGCEASATGTSRTVSITAGSVQINGEVIAVSAGSVTLDAGSTFDRYDLVSVNASGSKIVTKGTTKRKCPTQPADTCLLAIVFVPAGATVIATGDVYDARMDALRLSVAIINLVDHIETTRILLVASDETRISGFGSTPVTVPAIYIRGTVRAGGQALAARTGKIYVNGVLRDSWGGGDGGDFGYKDIVVEGGDEISFADVVTTSVYIKCSDALPVTRPESPTWS